MGVRAGWSALLATALIALGANEAHPAGSGHVTINIVWASSDESIMPVLIANFERVRLRAGSRALRRLQQRRALQEARPHDSANVPGAAFTVREGQGQRGGGVRPRRSEGPLGLLGRYRARGLELPEEAVVREDPVQLDGRREGVEGGAVRRAK